MMNRVDITQLKKVEEVFGDFDIDQTYSPNSEVYLRFGYWERIDKNKLEEIIGNSIEERDDYDDDCGYKFCYVLNG